MDSKDFVDYAGFYISLAALDELIELSIDPATSSGLDLDVLKAHRAKAQVMLKIIAPTMDDGINVLLRQMVEKAGLRVKTVFDTALTGNAVTGYRKRAKLLAFVFDRLTARSNAVREILDDAAQKGLSVMRAAGQATPAGRIAAVASVATASGSNTRMKKWSMVASDITGNPVSETDVLDNDITEAKALTQIAQVTQQKIDTRNPGDADMPDLSEHKALTETRLDKSIAQSVNPQIVQTVVAIAKQEASKQPNITIVGQRIKGGLTAPQEECVMSRGRVIMASGAGSGKTRVLASKVIYHIQEQKLSPSNVMAVSFSRKSSAELKARIKKFGDEAGVSMDLESNSQGMGTTHSIARMILNQSKRYRVSGNPNAPESEQPIGGEMGNKLLRAAIAQVKMTTLTRRDGTLPIPSDAMTFFPRLGTVPFNTVNPITEVKQPISQPVQAAPALQYYLDDPSRFAKLMATVKTALTNAQGSLVVKGTPRNTSYGPKMLVTVSGPGLAQFGSALSGFKINGAKGKFEDAKPQYRTPDQFVWWAGPDTSTEAVKKDLFATVGMDTVGNSLSAVQAMGTDPTKLSDAQKSILQGIVSQPVVASTLSANNMSVGKVAAAGSKELTLEGYESRKDAKEANSDISDFAYFLNNPANMWFNLGATDKDFEAPGDDGKPKKISPGVFKRYIGLNKNNLKAPGLMFKDKPDGDVGEDAGLLPKHEILAAVYGAYEWLKANHPKTKGRLDYDDQLIQAVRVLTEDPSLLGKLQMQYKCVMVDEAQDLNQCQDLLFGLVAGYLDPTNLKPRADGKMSADTFAYVGDDKQAIFEFRGADPDRFIEKSQGGTFKTLMLDKNFRSGSAIVDAANQLATHNTRTIPMVCTTDPKKGTGSILRERVGLEDEGPGVVVNQILSDLDDLKANDGVVPKGFYKRYGLATRTNRELNQYQMALIGAGIPFRSKRNPFEGPVLGPIVGVLRMFLPDSTVDVRNKGFLMGLKTPDIGVSPRTVADRLDQARAGDYYQFCQDGGYKSVYQNSGYSKAMYEALKNYSEKYLPELEKALMDGTSTEFLTFITSTTGVDGQTFIDQLAVGIRNNPDEMEEAQALADQDDGDGIVTDAILRQQAGKPLEPLYTLAAKYPKPVDFIGYLNSLATKSLKLAKSDDEASGDDDLVTLDTCHGWKGLECENLFVPMSSGRFPIVRKDSPDPERAMESERRLAYVALTRGENKVTIIEATLRRKGEDFVPIPPSQFVTEACIQVKGTTKKDDPLEKQASGDQGMVTGSMDGYLMPVFEHLSGRTATEESSLEAQYFSEESN